MHARSGSWGGTQLASTLLGIFVETLHDCTLAALSLPDTPGKPRAVYRHRGERSWEQLLEEAEWILAIARPLSWWVPMGGRAWHTQLRSCGKCFSRSSVFLSRAKAEGIRTQPPEETIVLIPPLKTPFPRNG